MSRALLAQVKKLESQLGQFTMANEPLDLSIAFVSYAYDRDGNLVFDKHGQLAGMVHCSMTFGDGNVYEYPNEVMEFLHTDPQGQKEMERIQAKAKANYVAYTSQGNEWRMPKHGKAIGTLCDLKKSVLEQ